MDRPTDTPLPPDQSWILDTGVTRRHALASSVVAAGYALAAQPLSATALTTKADGLDAGMVTFATNGIDMGAYRAKPKGKTHLPVIIVVQEIFGLHEWVRDIVRRLAHAGYYAIAPDLFQRQGDATKIADFRQLFSEIVSRVPDAQVMADLDALTRFVGTDGGNAKRLGLTGFCWGGRITWLYAAHNPALKAGVAWYGRVRGAAAPLQPSNPIDMVAQIKTPVLGLYGGQDKGIPVADVAAMNAALKAAKSPSAIHLYDQADHGFLADYRPSYDDAAARDAWARALGHFKKHL